MAIRSEAAERVPRKPPIRLMTTVWMPPFRMMLPSAPHRRLKPTMLASNNTGDSRHRFVPVESAQTYGVCFRAPSSLLHNRALIGIQVGRKEL